MQRNEKCAETHPLGSIRPNALLHDAKLADTQLLVDAYRIGWYDMLIAGQFTRWADCFEHFRRWGIVQRLKVIKNLLKDPCGLSADYIFMPL